MPQDEGIYPKYVVFKHPRVEAETFEAKAVVPFTDRGGNLGYQARHMDLVDDFCFVLKPIHDKHARIAMAAYAESVKEKKPKLAADLYEILGDY